MPAERSRPLPSAHAMTPDRAGLRGALVWAAIAGVVAVALLPVLLHPDEVLYSKRSDIFSGHESFRQSLVRSLQEEGWPALWNPTSFGGAPLVSDPQAALFYLPNWLHALSSPTESLHWYGWLLVLHLLAGGWGAAWWLRGQGFGASAQVAGGVVFALSAKWFAHLVTAGHVGFLPLVWLPWQLGLVDGIWREPTGRRAAALALVTGLSIPGTHPQLLAYASLLLVAYALLAGKRRSAPRPARSLALLATAGVLALAIAAIHLLPVATGADAFLRSDGLSYAKAATGALSPGQLLAAATGGTMPLPGAPGGGPPALSVGGEWERVVHVGVAATALALFAWGAREARRAALFFALVCALCLWYAAGEAGGLHRWLHEWAPGFALFRIPTRVLLVLGLPLGFLASAGLSHLCRRPLSRGARVQAWVLLGCGLLLLGAVRSVEAAAAAAAFALPALVAVPRSERVAARLGAVAAALVVAEMLLFAVPRVHTRPIREIAGTNPAAEAIAAPLGAGRYLGLALNRVGDPRFVSAIPRFWNGWAQLESLNGYNPLIPRANFRFVMGGIARAELSEPWTETYLPAFRLKSRRHLDVFDVRWVVLNQAMSLPGLVLRGTFDEDQFENQDLTYGGTTFVRTYLYENVRRTSRAALVRRARPVDGVDAAIAEIGRPAFDPTREVLVEDRALVGSYPGDFQRVERLAHHRDRLELAFDAGAGGYLVISEVWSPHWRAEADGAPLPLHRGNGIFQVAEVGPGEHRVVLRYRPAAYEAGRWISLASLAGAIALAAFGGAQPRGVR